MVFLFRTLSTSKQGSISLEDWQIKFWRKTCEELQPKTSWSWSWSSVIWRTLRICSLSRSFLNLQNSTSLAITSARWRCWATYLPSRFWFFKPTKLKPYTSTMTSQLRGVSMAARYILSYLESRNPWSKQQHAQGLLWPQLLQTGIAQDLKGFSQRNH